VKFPKYILIRNAFKDLCTFVQKRHKLCTKRTKKTKRSIRLFTVCTTSSKEISVVSAFGESCDCSCNCVQLQFGDCNRDCILILHLYSLVDTITTECVGDVPCKGCCLGGESH
jgi:hypothetical protein